MPVSFPENMFRSYSYHQAAILRISGCPYLEPLFGISRLYGFADNQFAQITVFDSGYLRFLWKQAGCRHSGQGIEFQAVQIP